MNEMIMIASQGVWFLPLIAFRPGLYFKYILQNEVVFESTGAFDTFSAAM